MVKNFPSKFLADVADLTERNDHTGARILVAQQLKLKGYVKAYEAVQVLHNFWGEMPSHLSKTRLALDRHMLDQILHEYGSEGYREIARCL